MYISKDRSENPHTDFFDMEFNHLDMRMKDPNSSNEQLPQKPARFNDMIEIAKALSKEIPHVRVDFYMVDDKIYVGELTFYHCGGFALITPEEWAKKNGRLDRFAFGMELSQLNRIKSRQNYKYDLKGSNRCSII